jgi:hypothetical protein
MSESKSESNDRGRAGPVSRVVASVAILVGSHSAADKAPDQPTNSTRDQSAATQPVGPDSNATPARVASSPGRVDPQPRSVQAAPHTNQRPAPQPPGLSTPSNRETVGPAHNRPRVDPTGTHSTNPTNRRDHPPEQPGVIPESQKMLLKGEGADDIERQHKAERGSRRPQPPTPSAQPIRPDNSRPQHDGRYTPPQPKRQPQPPNYEAHPPNREGRRAADREARRVPQTRTSSPQRTGAGAGDLRYQSKPPGREPLTGTIRGSEQQQRQYSAPPQRQGPEPQRQYSSPQNRGPQNQHAQHQGPQHHGPQKQHPRHQQPPNGSGREGNDQPPRRPPSK